MHHAKTDSEVTSLTASSPTRSPPRRLAYYVQSPSRDSFSHDGDKTTTVAATNSFHSTPAASPPHSPLGRHSRHSSSSTRFSGSRKISPSSAAVHGGHKPWKEIDVIEEEALLAEDRDKGLPRRCYILAFVLGFFVLFSLFSLILWGASRPMKPEISMKSIQFDHLRIQAGSDSTGVATDMISVNSTVKFTYRNKGTFFGVHVSSTPLDLSYSEIVVASGNMKEFYQSRKSQRLVSVAVTGGKIPLYGSDASLGLSSTTGVPTVPVPLNLSFVMRSRANVLGKLVRPKYYKRIECSIKLDPKKLGVSVLLKNSCTYD